MIKQATIDKWQQKFNEATTPKQARAALHGFLAALAKSIGYDAPVRMDEGYDGHKAVVLAWEGPYAWTLGLTAWGNPFAEEMGAETSMFDVFSNPKVAVECETSYSMSFYDGWGA